MADIHDLEPVIAHGFQRRNALAHTVHENFAAAAGNGAETGGFEIADDFFERLVEDFAEMKQRIKP